MAIAPAFLVMCISELFGSSVIYSPELVVSLLTFSWVGKCLLIVSKGSILSSPMCFSSRCQMLAKDLPFPFPRLYPLCMFSISFFFSPIACRRRVLFVVLFDVQPFVVVSPPHNITFSLA